MRATSRSARYLAWFCRLSPARARLFAALTALSGPVLLTALYVVAPTISLWLSVAVVGTNAGASAWLYRDMIRYHRCYRLPAPAPRHPLAGHIPDCALERGADCTCDAVIGGA